MQRGGNALVLPERLRVGGVEIHFFRRVFQIDDRQPAADDRRVGDQVFRFGNDVGPVFRRGIFRVDRRLAALAIIGQVAPLLGLLGTVVGFIRTVLLVNSQAIVSRVNLLNASMEALVSAALGLAVAILVVVMYGSLRVRVDRITVELEAAASQITGYITTREAKK